MTIPLNDSTPPSTGEEDASSSSSLEDAPTLPPSGDSAPTIPHAAQAATQRRFGDYDLLEEIARGGMGVVYKARQRSLNRVVALKMILAGQLAGPEDIQRFHIEAQAAAHLDHPGITPIYEIGEREGQHYFTMGFVEGMSLAQKLSADPVSPHEAAALVKKIADAIGYAHEQGVIHRDLKPGNVLLDKHGEPKVTDFGLAKYLKGDSNLTRTDQILGTPNYMAPEQAAGDANQVGPLSDVYSLGSILYTLLAGRPPFESHNPLDVILQVLEKEPLNPSQVKRGVPRSMDLICLRCLEKKPESRYPSARALAEDLERFLVGDPVEAKPAGWGRRVRRWARREPVLAAHWVALAVGAGILQIIWIFFGSNLPYHLQNMATMVVWAAAAFGLQRLLERDRWAPLARSLWAVVDVSLLTLLIYQAYPPRGPLLIGYPLLVIASGMFFRVRLVALMTALCLTGYGILLATRPEVFDPPYYSMIFASLLLVIGMIVAYQSHRFVVLNRYYECRQTTQP